jgi:hypothetical protein
LKNSRKIRAFRPGSGPLTGNTTGVLATVFKEEFPLQEGIQATVAKAAKIDTWFNLCSLRSE